MTKSQSLSSSLVIASLHFEKMNTYRGLLLFGLDLSLILLFLLTGNFSTDQKAPDNEDNTKEVQYIPVQLWLHFSFRNMLPTTGFPGAYLVHEPGSLTQLPTYNRVYTRWPHLLCTASSSSPRPYSLDTRTLAPCPAQREKHSPGLGRCWSGPNFGSH